MGSRTPKAIAAGRAGTWPREASLPGSAPGAGGGAGHVTPLFICLFSSPFPLISFALDALLFLTSSAAPGLEKAPCSAGDSEHSWDSLNK